jgi:hypothetical protein
MVHFALLKWPINQFKPVHRGAFCQYYGCNKSTGKETGKTHLCAVRKNIQQALRAYCPKLYTSACWQADDFI